MGSLSGRWKVVMVSFGLVGLGGVGAVPEGMLQEQDLSSCIWVEVRGFDSDRHFQEGFIGIRILI